MKRYRSYWSHDVGIDLGTANVLVYVRGVGIIIREPSAVAINKKSKQILAIGEKAQAMIGKTPRAIAVIRPLIDGVISDFEVTEQMLRYFLKKVHEKRFVIWQRPRVIIGIPSGVTEVERRAVESAAQSAGAGKTYLVEEPMAAAIGCKLDVMAPEGQMVVDIGGGTTEVAVISLGGIVVSRSLRVAGDELTDQIIQFLRDDFNLQIGEHTAEKVKLTIGNAYPLDKAKTIPVRGRDLVSGLPKQVAVDSDRVRLALGKPVRQIVEAVRTTLEETPPELVADIMEHGIILAGGGALLTGLDRLITADTKILVKVATDPLACVVRGTGSILDDMAAYRSILMSSEVEPVTA